ncbi:MAG: pitrilysin family protein [Hyphomonadaceae bacterium]
MTKRFALSASRLTLTRAACLGSVLALSLAACATPAQEGPAAGASPAVAAAAAVPAASSQTIADIKAMDLEIPYTRYVLDNGLTLLVHQDAKTPTVTFHIWYHVGSAAEPKGRSGFAHLFEHLMFNGSENFNDDFFKATQQVGATNMNGTTNTDRTNYFETVPKEAIDSILWLESDRMGYLLGAVDQARLDEQRGVVQNEKRQGENQPYGQVYNHMVAATYPEAHPYGHTVIGSMEDLNAATLADVQDWFKTWYGPSNAVLVIAGDITPEEAKAKVEKYFGEIPPGSPVSHAKAWTPVMETDQREVMYDRVATPRVYRVWNVPELGHPDGELLDVVASALAGDKNARLTKRLVHDEQIATGVSAFNSQRELSGQFQIVVSAKPDADIGYIEKVVDEELAKLLAEGPTQAEIEKLQVGTIRGMVDTMERAPSKASLLATWETFRGDADEWKASLNRLKAATPQLAAEAGRKWLTKGSYTLEVLPFGDPKAFAPAVDRSAMPKPATVADAGFPDFTTTTLSNGMKVYLAERHDAPLVNVNLLLNTGYPADFASITEGVGPLTVSLLDEGTESLTGLEIADKLDLLGASIGAGGGGQTATVSMSSLTATLDPVLDIFADVIRHPAFRETDFKRLQAQQVQGVRQSLTQPNSIASIVMSRELWGADHPFGRIQTPESVEAITREDIEAFHKRWFGPNNATLIVVGDTTLEEIKPKLEAKFADWAPAPGQRLDAPTVPRPPAPKVFLVDRPGSLQSVIRVGAPLPPRNPEEDYRIGMFNDLFGGNFTSRVNMNLREDKGWSYGARTSVSGGVGPRSFMVSAPVQTDATKGALQELRKELTDVVGSRPPTAKELDEAKTNEVLGLSSRYETGSQVAGTLYDIAQFGLSADHYANAPTYLRQVTLDDVRKTAKELLPDQNLVWVIVGDLSKIEADVRSLNLGEVTVVDARGEPVR